MITTTLSSTELNLDFVSASRLLLPSYDSISLCLAGCGGTGSWLAPSVARVARLLIEKFDKRVSVFFIDPDKVEAKNVYRQNFCEAEIGRNKADTLAFRYGLAWGVNITAIPDAFGDHLRLGVGVGMYVLIGCVDNARARKAIAAVAKRSARDHTNLWWLDCGNFQSAGQVLLGCGKKTFDSFGLPGLCSWLPLPSDVHPELLEDVGGSQLAVAGEEGMSCADMALADSQGLAINQRIAAEATDYLVRMLLTRDLMKMATYIDLASGSSRSVYIIPESFRQDR